MKKFDEFIDDYSTNNNLDEDFRRFTSGAAYSKVKHLEDKVLATNDLDEKINLLATMISIQSGALFARDLMNHRR